MELVLILALAVAVIAYFIWLQKSGEPITPTKKESVEVKVDPVVATTAVANVAAKPKKAVAKKPAAIKAPKKAATTAKKPKAKTTKTK